MACVCFGQAGCELFNRRPAEGGAFAPGARSGNAQGEPVKRAEPSDPITGMNGNGNATAFLAGQVINGQSGQPTEAFIRFKCLDDPKEEEAPIEVEAKADGYFTIQGLKPGKHYQLSARTKQGDRILAGVSYNQAPDIRVVIKVRADLASTTTPPIPGVPAYEPKKKAVPKKEDSDKKQNPTGMEQPASATIQVWEPGSPKVQIQMPGTNPVIPAQADQRLDSPGAAPSPPVDPNRMAIIGQLPPKLPTMTIRINAPVPLTESPPPKSWGTAPNPTSWNTTVVPSCVLVSNQLINFALRDLNGEPWIYKERKHGKLTLIDFWATTCLPCRQCLPGLMSLQNKYGPAGLEVIGIACEPGGTPAEQGQRVTAVAAKAGVTYPLLLASGPQCPVVQNFFVTRFPTLVLVDETGGIRWRHVGIPEQKDIDILNRIIQERLGRN